jgi:hypothetical protein
MGKSRPARNKARPARNKARHAFMQSRVAFLMMASDEYDARGVGSDDEKAALRTICETLSAKMIGAAELIESVEGLQRQEQLFLFVDGLIRSALSLGELIKNSPFIERAVKNRRAARARTGLDEVKKRRIELLSPLILRSVEKNPEWKPGGHAKSLLFEANELLAKHQQRKIGHRTLVGCVIAVMSSSPDSLQD